MRRDFRILLPLRGRRCQRTRRQCASELRICPPSDIVSELDVAGIGNYGAACLSIEPQGDLEESEIGDMLCQEEGHGLKVPRGRHSGATETPARERTLE